MLIISMLLPYNNVNIDTKDIDKPINYYKSNKYMVEYFSQIKDEKERVEEVLKIIKLIFPDWEENYKVNKFDCSEMSEFVRFFLRKAGIKSYYMQSDGLWHCWVEVPLKNKEKLLIEAITLRIVPKKEWDYYYQYNDVKRNPNMKKSEIDWWNSEYFFEKLTDMPVKIQNILD